MSKLKYVIQINYKNTVNDMKYHRSMSISNINTKLV